jgi:hypothetical protein
MGGSENGFTVDLAAGRLWTARTSRFKEERALTERPLQWAGKPYLVAAFHRVSIGLVESAVIWRSAQ